MTVVESMIANEDGTLTGVLVRDGVRVCCDGIAWWDDVEGDELEALYEEWVLLASVEEEGYTVL
jgi:hypothetical protein